MAGELWPYERSKLIAHAVSLQHLSALWSDEAMTRRQDEREDAGAAAEIASSNAAYARRALLHLIHGERIDD